MKPEQHLEGHPDFSEHPSPPLPEGATALGGVQNFLFDLSIVDEKFRSFALRVPSVGLEV